MIAKDLLALAIDWLRDSYPGSVIVSELSVADWGGASVDVAAITETHIVGVEIKGDGDSPARLDRQGLAYGMVCQEMWLLPAPSLLERCRSRRPSGWGMLEVWEGTVRPLNRATKSGERVKTKYGTRVPQVRDDSRYVPGRALVGGLHSGEAAKALDVGAHCR